MAKKVNISIPTPCRENWLAMQTNEQGRFCLSCQKTVIDFTNQSDKEIAETILQHQGKICGRFRQSQLRTIALPEPKISRTHFQTYFFALANAIVASLSVPTHAKAQIPTEIKSNKDYVNIFSTKEQVREQVKPKEKLKDSEKLTIGKVRGEEGDNKYYDLPGANVSLKGTSIGTITDENGDFLLEINKNFSEAIIVFAFVGFETKEVKISTINKNAPVRANAIVLNIDLALDSCILTGEVVIIDYHGNVPLYKKIYYKLRN
ncbi:carboxypeptidase-like regulatory domain-containing protein [Thermoflexibacter ruber]|uniref:CarboxypepD_reg-like domain-containing protein n=1 Tax=Thermoflexibacter ruber TaxID=1003 RepID=A0A1I2H7Z3_9BACT|nr:carboxypeptidase-like regulatory domain-containing protein [Thermoflexibacter ruber]SFF25698.1 CarboxypepD_reg-like domain-containing protein [Thermoflexibacter ruber]